MYAIVEKYMGRLLIVNTIYEMKMEIRSMFAIFSYNFLPFIAYFLCDEAKDKNKKQP